MQAYSKCKTRTFGKCNICGNEAKLTWDHVPPKFCYNSDKTIYNNIFKETRSFEDKFNKFNISQNGIKFKSICAECNNNLLGRNYDTELMLLVDKIKEFVYSDSTQVNGRIYINVKINKVVRAIIGHLLAAKENFDDCLIDVKLREYLLNPSALPPKDMQLLWRIYPYSAILLIRDISTKRVTINKPPLPEGVISCMSAFPFAVILTSTPGNTCGLEDLFLLCTDNIEDIIQFPIDILSIFFEGTSLLRPLMWPCNISDEIDGTDLILVGNSIDYSVIAYNDKEKII